MRKVLVCTVLFLLMAFTINANAVPIVFTHEGSGSYSLDGSPSETASFIITAYGDTANRVSFGSGFFIDHDLANIQIDGLGILTFITPTRTFVNNSVQVPGFSRAGNSGLDLFNGPNNPVFGAWDMLSSIGPINGTGNLLQWTSSDVITDSGVLVFASGGTDMTFQARIPEPSTMLLLGGGLFGLALFRRRFRK